MDLAGVGNYTSVVYKKGRFSTAHVYKNALFSFSNFCGTQNVSFRQVTRECLRRYGQHLSDCGLKPNTVSTYMRMLRSVYNRGVESGGSVCPPDCFMMYIPEWTFGRNARCRFRNCISFCMRIPRRTVCDVHRPLPD